MEVGLIINSGCKQTSEEVLTWKQKLSNRNCIV